jgi:predicted enzyme related to lactoylglutathione lyase
MSGPARAGLFVYALDPERMSRFYEAVAGMRRLHASDELIVLQSPDIQLLVHRIPASIAAGMVISSPPVRRENCAYKFFFTVASLAETGSLVGRLGGVVFPDQWQGPGFLATNACDPEGNVFQIRQRLGPVEAAPHPTAT